MRRVARYLYVGTAWLTLVGLIIPFFVAGMALFVCNAFWATHREIGWLTGWPFLVLIITGLLGWIPRKLTAWLVGMLVLHTVHTLLPSLRSDLPMIAAIHPVTALLLAWVTYMHARKANEILLEPRQEAERMEPQVAVETSTHT